uniref:Putative ovule protein n=1 Tax=Solanum chacoense TaxID=4108 RepID=A0A0V0GZL1_SOLCH
MTYLETTRYKISSFVGREKMKKHAELSPTLVQKDNFDLCIHLAYTSKVFFNFLKFVSSQTLSHKMGRKKYYIVPLCSR